MAKTAMIAKTLRALVRPGMSPKALRTAVREHHPEASRKEIARAAFYALTDAGGSDAQSMTDLHHFALAERGADEEAPQTVKPRKKRKHRRAEDEAGRAAH